MYTYKGIDKVNIEHWENFYKKFELNEESPFCKYIKSKIDNNTIIIDLGCGTGRDSRSFIKDGFQVIGIDRSQEAIAINNNFIQTMNQPSISSFKVIDISIESEIHQLIKKISKQSYLSGKKLLVYSRFFLHSVDKKTENILLKSVNENLNVGDLFAAEFRTSEDVNRYKLYNNHFRRYINSDELVRKIERKYNFKVIEYTKGTGLSKFKDEDPFLARILLEKF